MYMYLYLEICGGTVAMLALVLSMFRVLPIRPPRRSFWCLGYWPGGGVDLTQTKPHAARSRRFKSDPK